MMPDEFHKEWVSQLVKNELKIEEKVMRSVFRWLMILPFFLLSNFALMAQNLPHSKSTPTQFTGNCGDQEEILRDLRTSPEMLNQQIRLPWMDTMKKLYIQQAAFRVQFSVQDKRYTFIMDAVKYLRCYYRYDSALGSVTSQMKSEITELEYALTPVVLKRAIDWVRVLQNDPSLKIIAKNKSLTEFCGTLYLNFLDDERLTVMDEPADVKFNCHDMKGESHNIPSSKVKEEEEIIPLVALQSKTNESHLGL